MIEVGNKINELTVIEIIRKNGRTYGKCECSCGNTCEIRVDTLKRGQKSCGCKYRKWNGRSNHRLYSIWCKMKDRCYNSENSKYNYYGGRGIAMSEEFLDFNKFYDWAMMSGYENNLEIDRIDNNKGYERSNCRFATRRDQMCNTRTNSEYPGVCYDKKRDSYNAYIYKRGHQKTKRFYVKKHGKELAYELAKKERQRMVNE